MLFEAWVYVVLIPILVIVYIGMKLLSDKHPDKK